MTRAPVLFLELVETELGLLASFQRRYRLPSLQAALCYAVLHLEELEAQHCFQLDQIVGLQRALGQMRAAFWGHLQKLDALGQGLPLLHEEGQHHTAASVRPQPSARADGRVPARRAPPRPGAAARRTGQTRADCAGPHGTPRFSEDPEERRRIRQDFRARVHRLMEDSRQLIDSAARHLHATRVQPRYMYMPHAACES